MQKDNSYYSYWSKEDDAQLKELMDQGELDYMQMSQLMNRSPASIQKRGVILGLTYFYRRKYGNGKSIRLVKDSWRHRNGRMVNYV